MIIHRSALLWALEKHWPEVLERLERDVLPLYEESGIHSAFGIGLVLGDDGKPGQTRDAPIIREVWRLGDQASRFLYGVTEWALEFRVLANDASRMNCEDELPPEWLTDAVLSTLQAWTLQKECRQTVSGKWTYFDQHVSEPFRFLGGDYVPGLVGEAAFKKGQRAAFEKQIKEYVERRTARWGDDRGSVDMHAEWAVLGQKGSSAPEIIAAFPGMNVTIQSVTEACHTFCERVGIRSRQRADVKWVCDSGLAPEHKPVSLFCTFLHHRHRRQE
jgi:hypothetical protein